MKTLLPFLFSFFFSTGYSQLYNAMPAEAASFYESAIQKIKPEMISFIKKKSLQLSGRNVDADSLFNALKKEPDLKYARGNGIKTISLLVLIECANNTDTKLKKVVMHLAKQNRDDLNSDATKPILEQKSMIAGQVSVLLKELGGDTTANLKDLQ